MAKISFISNIASLQAQRRLTENSKELSKTNEHLSSGLRITRASDNAAGIAIAASLNVDGRVFAQAIRNLNDGISLSNVAEGGIAGLRDIVFRLRELGEQSSNGVLTSVQRQSIDGEGQALISEYNRIISVTEFNGLKLLDGTLTNLTLQAGYGTAGELTVSIGQSLQRNLGLTTITADGSFQPAVSYTAGSLPYEVSLADLNGDGKLDAISAESTSQAVSVYLGNGNGTFQSRRSYIEGLAVRAVTVGDVNGDGKLDVVSASYTSSPKAFVRLGNGDGSLQAARSYSAGGASVADIVLADMNGDSQLDIITSDTGTSNKVNILLGNGNGTFKARTSYSGISDEYGLAVADFNGDGKVDVAVADNSDVLVFLGNGNGTLKARTSYASDNPRGVSVGDLNGDSYVDIAVGETSTFDRISVYLGNGNGSFKARVSYLAGDNPREIILADINGDGKLDVVSADQVSNTVSIYLNNGDGTLRARTSLAAAGTGPRGVAVGDLNGDSYQDILSSAYSGKINTLLANTITSTTAISFLTQASSLVALTTLASVQTSIENELANIGSIQSRLGTALTNLQQTRENYNAAESRIVDVDVAEESANLVKRQILQDTASAILAQANQEPALLLRLLKP